MEIVKLLILIPVALFTLLMAVGYAWHLILVPLFGNPLNPENKPVRVSGGRAIVFPGGGAPGRNVHVKGEYDHG